MAVQLNPFKRFSYREQVSRSLSWGHYFIFINILLSCFLGFGYVYAAPPSPNFLSFVYLILTCLGHMSFLTIVVFLIIFFPLAFIGNFRYYRVLSVILAIICHTIVLFDIKIYLMVKVHLSYTAISLIVRELDFDTGLNYNFLFIAVPIVMGIEYAFAKITTHSLYKAHHPILVKSILMFLGACFISSHLLHIWADAYKYDRITLLRSTFPAHYPMTAKSFLTSHGWMGDEELDYAEQSNKGEYIRYPLSAINIDDNAKAKNLLVITINRFSYGDMSLENTPNLLRLKNEGQSFEEHYLLYQNEMDNVFSLNYGLPLQYRRAMLSGNIFPVTVDEMYRQDYVRRILVSDTQGLESLTPNDDVANPLAKNNAYYRSLLENSSLRAPQLGVNHNAKELFLGALEQINGYHVQESRPYAMTLVINDLRKAEAFYQDCMTVKDNLLIEESLDEENALDAISIVEPLITDDKELVLSNSSQEDNTNELTNQSQSTSQAKDLELAKSTSQGEGQSAVKGPSQGEGLGSSQSLAQGTSQKEDQSATQGELLGGSQGTASGGKTGLSTGRMPPKAGSAMHGYGNAYKVMNERYGAWFENEQCKLPSYSEDNYLFAGDALLHSMLTYEHNLRYVDAMIGTFINALQDSGLLDNTIVMITSTEGNSLLKSGNQRFDRIVQHVPLIVLWPDEQRKARNSEILSSHLDIFATVAQNGVNITTQTGNYTLGASLKNLGNRDFLLVDGSQMLILVGKDDNVIYSQDGESYVERHSERLQVRPNLENLIEAMRDLNRFLR